MCQFQVWPLKFEVVQSSFFGIWWSNTCFNNNIELSFYSVWFLELVFKKHNISWKKWTLFFDIFCPLYIALLDMDDARGTFVTFKKLFNSCRHELEEWWSMMDILAKILKLNVLMRKKCLLYIVPTSFFFIWGHSNIKIVIFYTEVVVFLFDEWNDWKKIHNSTFRLPY